MRIQDRRVISAFLFALAAGFSGCGGISSGSGSSTGCGPSQKTYDTDPIFLLNALTMANSAVTANVYSGGVVMAQSFEPKTNITVKKVNIPMKAYGDPDGTTVTVGIWSSFSGSPLAVLSSAAFLIDMTGGDANLSTTQVKTISFELGTPVPLTKDTTYWIHAAHNPAAADTNRAVWMTKTGNPYTGGAAMGYTTVWTALSVVAQPVDLAFTLGCD